jgi:DNA processing protein
MTEPQVAGTDRPAHRPTGHRTDPPSDLPEGAYAMALAHLPGVGPAWLAAAMERYGPREAWRLVKAGSLARPSPPGGKSRRGEGGLRAARAAEGWGPWAAGFDIAGRWRHCCAAGISVLWLGGPDFPASLTSRLSPAGVLFVAGGPSALTTRPAVAIIGTRDCTPDGAAIAFELAYDLAKAGVRVVSGLALGIDGAAHAGAVTACREVGDGAEAAGSADPGPTVVDRGPAPTVGVAASGVDVVYPSRHAGLWREVTRTGAIVSETPPGAPAQSWRFPARNRIIACLSRLVVVVECHAQGGSWHTVNAAVREGVDVGAVPGSVRNPAAYGTNCLLNDGAMVVRGVGDVLSFLAQLPDNPLAVAADQCRAAPSAPGAGMAGTDGDGDRDGTSRLRVGRARDQGGVPTDPVERHVLASLSGRPLCFDDIVERSGLPPTAVVIALEHLVDQGKAGEHGGWWTRM